LKVPFYFRISAIIAVFFILLSGCAVGPDFRQPEVPTEKTYTPAPLPAATDAAPLAGGEAQAFIYGRDIPAQWWTLFQSQPLDSLMRRALADSPTLAKAEAALRQAMENRRARFGSLLPSVDGSFSGNRQRLTGALVGLPDGSGSTYTLYNASVNVSYAVDLFGATRRELESLQAQIEYQRYLLEAAHLTLGSNIVTTAVQEASLRARIAATREILAAEEELLSLIERSYNLGGAAMPEVLAQRAQLSKTRATLPPLEKGLDQTRHLLAVLVGTMPANAGALPEFHLEDFNLPLDLPVSLPSSLVRQRPDIRASEELFHSACAQVGVATANLFPQLTISGRYGSSASSFSNLFSSGTSLWNIGGDLLQPIFRGGELTARRRAALAAFDEAGAEYRETVLQAFRNVADVLRALELDARTLKVQAEAESDARTILELTRKRYAYGSVGYPALLDAQRQHQEAVLTLVQARALRFSDTAALFQALGGGWWNRTEEPQQGAAD
jgi:NodT family efflux transporter outer membrane factor (OMF) lipoprotein